MKMKRLLCLLAVAPLCFLTASVGSAAYANSAQSHWSGADSFGLAVTEEDCPLVIESENLTFDLATFPPNYSTPENSLYDYDGKVTATYGFYNPASYTVNATLVFPFGKLPDYAYDFFDDDGQPVDFDDTAKYSVTVGGNAVESRIRYTLDRWNFDIEEHLPALRGELYEDSFFTLETPVTKYTYEVSGLNADPATHSAATAAFALPSENSGTKLLFNGSTMQTHGNVIRVGTAAENGGTITIYVIGNQNFTPQWTVYADGGLNNGDEIAGTVVPSEKIPAEQTDFYHLALSGRDGSSGVSDGDWYNAFVKSLLEVTYGNGTLLRWGNYGLDISRYLMRWYEYDIQIGAGERVQNVVQAPMYPSIDRKKSRYKYVYYLSPAATWASFGALDIAINTPYYLVDSNLNGFVKGENSYTLSLDALPQSELEFSLSMAGGNTGGGSATEEDGGGGFPVWTIAVICAGGASLIGGAVAAAIILKKRRTK